MTFRTFRTVMVILIAGMLAITLFWAVNTPPLIDGYTILVVLEAIAFIFLGAYDD